MNYRHAFHAGNFADLLKHAVLTALAQHVPFLALDEYFSDFTASSKVRELLVELGLEALYTCPMISTQPSLKLRLALAAAPRLEPVLIDMTAQLRDRLKRHYREMLTAANHFTISPGIVGSAGRDLGGVWSDRVWRFYDLVERK